MEKTTFSINPFCNRQTKESEFSFFDGSAEVLLELIQANFAKATKGYKPGVLQVPVPAKGFWSSIVEINDNNEKYLRAKFGSRREGEAPYISNVLCGGGFKQAASSVNLVLYSHEILKADGDASSEADWELISINAELGDTPSPMHPVTMARNFGEPSLEKPLTAGDAQELIQSIRFWSTHAQVQGDE